MDFDSPPQTVEPLNANRPKGDSEISQQTGKQESENVKDFPAYYTILSGALQKVEGDQGPWTTEWLLSEYVACTDGLIGKLDGSIPIDSATVFRAQEDGTLITEERALGKPDAVIYLDKSARPIEWMVRALWPVLSTHSDSDLDEFSVPPSSHFLNIDKKDWLRRLGVPPEHLEHPPEELVDISKVSREHLARIRALYIESPVISEDEVDKAWEHPTIFDGKHVMIVDETKVSGQTLRIAMQLLSMAIPEATFSGEYWSVPKQVALSGGAHIDGQVQFKGEWVPIWYSDTIVSGRGISGRDPRWPEIAPTKGYAHSDKRKVGRHILSTPPHEPETYTPIIDRLAQLLREDIKRMSADLQRGLILYRPSIDRPSASDSEFEQLKTRIESLSGLDFEDWKGKRDELMPKGRGKNISRPRK